VGLEMPQFTVLCDAEVAGPPPESFGKSIEFVYERYFLLRSWMVLLKRNKIEIPSEIETLVEVVYGEPTMVLGDDWNAALKQAKEQMEYNCNESERSASRLLVCFPKSPYDLIEEFNNQLADDEDPDVHRTVRAATREGDPSTTAVMLPANTVLTADPDVSEVRALLDRSVKLSHRGIFHSLLDTGRSPKEWARNAHLRHARLLRLNEQNMVRIGEYTLKVDEALGIVIEREGDINE